MLLCRRAATALSVILLLAAHADAATYYVSTSGNDASAGTQTQPFRSIAKGLSVLAPGDTLYIRGGTYSEQLFESMFGSSGTASAPITVAAYQSEVVVLRPSTSQGNVARFRDSTKSYVILDGLILDGATAGGGSGGSVFYCGSTTHDLHLNNVELRNGDGNGALCAGTNHEFRNMKVHHNGLYTGYTNSNGMYMTTDNTRIIGGEFYENECYGVRFADSDTSQSADNNVVDGARIYNNGYSVALGGASQCGSGGAGIVLGNVNNAAYNNVVYGNWWGFNSLNPSGLKLYNNTFYNNRNGVWISDGSNADVRNNIIYQNGSGITNNASATALSNNMTSDPQFTNAAGGDFSLRSSSPAIDAGVSLNVVKTDFRGVGRPQGGAYDVGAFEGSASAALPTAPTNVRILSEQ